MEGGLSPGRSFCAVLALFSSPLSDDLLPVLLFYPRSIVPSRFLLPLLLPFTAVSRRGWSVRPIIAPTLLRPRLNVFCSLSTRRYLEFEAALSLATEWRYDCPIFLGLTRLTFGEEL